MRFQFVAKALCAVALSSLIRLADAAAFANSAAAINATDSIVWNKFGSNGAVLFNPTSGASTNGLSFVAAKPSFGPMRVEALGGGDYCLDTQDSGRISLNFRDPVAAAGTTVFVSTPMAADLTVRAYDSSGAVVLETTQAVSPNMFEPTEFMGVVSAGANIKTLEYSTDIGVISVGSVALRPFESGGGGDSDLSGGFSGTPSPFVSNQFYTVPKNSHDVSPAPNVLIGATNVEGIRLIVGPHHAESFMLFADGTFDYKPVHDYLGADSFTFAGTAAGGRIQSVPAEVDIRVIAPNQRPSFSPGPDQFVEEDAGPQRVSRWATQISAGSDGEDRAQTLNWIIANDNPALFSDQPHLGRDGTLEYTPAFQAYGSAVLTIWLKDDGGIEDGGLDTSLPAVVRVTVLPVNHRPTLDPFSEQTLSEGATLQVRAIGSSVDYDRSLAYEIEDAPAGMTIDGLNGNIRWTPSAGDTGKSYAVKVKAVSGGDPNSSDSQLLIVNVTPSFAAMMGARTLVAANSSKKLSPGPAMGVAAMRIVGFRRAKPEAHHRRYWVE